MCIIYAGSQIISHAKIVVYSQHTFLSLSLSLSVSNYEYRNYDLRRKLPSYRRMIKKLYPPKNTGLGSSFFFLSTQRVLKYIVTGILRTHEGSKLKFAIFFFFFFFLEYFIVTNYSASCYFKLHAQDKTPRSEIKYINCNIIFLLF